MVRKQMFCNDGCREAYREDRRYGLNAGFDRFTDEMADERICIYCRSYVPTNAEKLSPFTRRALSAQLPASAINGGTAL